MDDQIMEWFSNSPIKKSLKKNYQRIPERIKPCFNPLLSGYSRFKQVYLPVYLFTGRTTTNEIPFTYAYVGTNLNHQNFWAHLILTPVTEKTFIGNHLLFNIPTRLKKSYPHCSMILWEESPFTTAFFNNKPAFRIPKWIRMEIDISKSMETVCRHKHSNYKRIRRKISQHDYNYLITQDASAFKDFYDNMYAPYVSKRFDGTGIILPYSNIFDSHTPVDLFLIRKSEMTVAGAVVKYQAGKAVLCWFGVLQGNFDHVREGVLGAAYYFVIKEMQKKGFATIDIGDSRPIMNYGVTWHKISLLARINDSFERNSNENLLLTLLHDCQGLRDFLANNQIIYITKDNELNSTSWIQQPSLLSQDEFRDMAILSRRTGFHRHHFILFKDAKIPQEWFEMDHDRHLSVTKAQDYFLQSKMNNGWRLWG